MTFAARWRHAGYRLVSHVGLRFASLFIPLLAVLTFSITALTQSAAAQAGPEGALWLADGSGAVRLEPGDGAPGNGNSGEESTSALPGTADSRALAVDAAGGRVWIWAGEALLAFDLAGESLGAVEAPAAAEGALLRLDTEAGLLWLAGEDGAVRALSPEGVEVLALDVGEAVRDAVLSTSPEGPGPLWVATASSLSSWDRESGEPLRELELGTGFEGTGFEAAALAPASEGGLWVAVVPAASGRPTETEGGSGDPGVGDTAKAEAHGEVRLYDASGELLASFAVEAPTALLPDGLAAPGGLWVADGSWLRRLEILNTEGDTGESALALEEAAAVQPLGESFELRHLALDAATLSVWAAGVEGLFESGSEGNSEGVAGETAAGKAAWRLARVDLGGYPRQTLELASGPVQIDGLRDLGVSPGEADTAAPELEILEPAEGEVVATRRPSLRLSASDDGSGVRWDSLILERDGTALSADCRPNLLGTEAVCGLLEDLPEGDVQIEAAVADWLDNLSPPARVAFRIETGTGGGGGGEPEPPPYPYFNPPDASRGVEPNKVYQFGGVETIDPASGNLALRVPLGQVYAAGPLISYQLAVAYNSNVWQSVPIACVGGGGGPPCEDWPFSIPNVHSNVGVGWEFHFGRLYSYAQPDGLPHNGVRDPRWPGNSGDPAKPWLYVAPDGASHWLYPLKGRDTTNGSWPVLYSKDGSQLRLVQVDADTVEVSAPDGVVSVFEKTDQRAGTQFCGGGISGCWRFDRLRDPFGNYVSASYASNASTETWTIQDSSSTGADRRTHKVIFDVSAAGRAGGDGTGSYTTAEGDEWGDARRILQRVELAAFGETTATYTFHYRTSTMLRGCPHSVELGSHKRLTTKVLERIGMPDSHDYHFTTESGSDPGGVSACSDMNGRVTAVTLPTQGQWEYDYATWHFPTRCYYREDMPQLEDEYGRYGVVAKHQKTRKGDLAGTWRYQSELITDPPLAGHEHQGVFCRRANYRKTTIIEPKVGQMEVHRVSFHSTAEGKMIPRKEDPKTSWRATDHGLPINKDVRVGPAADPLFLSQEVWECGGSCVKKRSVYRRYTGEWRGCSKTGQEPCSASGFGANPQLLAERTVFHQDSGRWVERTFSRYDGAGHFEREVVVDNFPNPAGSARDLLRRDTEYTTTGSTVISVDADGYLAMGTPSAYLPSPSQRWILNPYRKMTTTSGSSTHVREAAFHHSLLRCDRRWRDSGQRSGQDLLTQYRFDGQGLAIEEARAGGDAGSLPTDSVCPSMIAGIPGSALSGSKLVFGHEYQHQSLRRTSIAGYPFTLDLTIDRNTGLPSASRDSAGLETTLFYDLAGRLIRAVPESGLGEAETQIRYQFPPGKAIRIVEERLWQSQAITRKVSILDDFGRLDRELIRRPSSQPGVAFEESKRQTLYDAAGRVASETTLQSTDDFLTSRATKYENHDAFGRPTRVTAPDGQVTSFVFRGMRKTTRTVSVRTSQASASSVSTSEESDGLGRLERVDTPKHITRHAYDASGALISSTRSSGGTSQTRRWSFDGRGLRTQEILPEVGALATPGKVTYTFDALGQVRSRHDGLRLLSWTYDTGGRPTRVAEGSRVWQEWAYGSGDRLLPDGTTSREKGRLVRAVRHNYVGGGPSAPDWAVEQRYEYAGNLGLLSRATTQLSWPQNAPGQRLGPSFTFTRGYDPLGNPAVQSLPVCADATANHYCNGPGDTASATHNLSTAYSWGLPVSVSSSPWGLSADYEYHPNLQLARRLDGNGVEGVFDPGTQGMNRPSRILYRKGLATLFDSGLYQYDGAGNIWAIGADRYTYDEVSRLTYATLRQAGPPTSGSVRFASYAYDTFDNATFKDWDEGPAYGHVYDAKNRYLRSSGDTQTNNFYDAAGNLKEIGRYGSQPAFWELTYDSLNHVTGFHDRLQGVEHLYIYGPGEYRFLTYTAQGPEQGTKTYHLRDVDGKVLREIKGRGWGPGTSGEIFTLEKGFVHGPSGLIATRSPTQGTRYFHTDHLGSPRLLTGATGAVIGRHHYYPYGSEARIAGPRVDEPLSKFTGHQRDPAGRTDYMLGRTCLFPMMRFSSVDPGRDGWNLYAYGAANPIRYVDPDGRTVTTFAVTDTKTQRDREFTEDTLMTFVDETYEDYGLLGFALSYPVSVAGRVLLSVGAPSSPEEIALNAMGFSLGVRAPGVGVGTAAQGSTVAGSRGTGPAHSASNALRLRNQLAAREIASGHAFERHVIQRGEFPGVGTQGQFAEVVEGVLNRPTHVRELARGRTASFNEGSGILVIRNPAAPDGGTAFVPTNGLDYFLGLQ